VTGIHTRNDGTLKLSGTVGGLELLDTTPNGRYHTNGKYSKN